MDMSEQTGLLPGFARLAARVTGAGSAVITRGGELVATAGLAGWDKPGFDIGRLTAACQDTLTVIPDLWRDERFAGLASGTGDAEPGDAEPRFVAMLPLLGGAGERLGVMAVLDPMVRPGLTAEEAAALQDVAGLVTAALLQERRHAALAEATRRAVRVDRMLCLVSEAVSCAEALTTLLTELCLAHGAPVGRIWKLSLPEGLMVEVSRFNEHAYYQRPPSAPVRAGNSTTAMAIGHNEPQTLIYSQVENPAQFALLQAAMASGLRSQVSYPIWVQEERFGVALMFPTERTDLEVVVADIASLAHAIRPALFRKITEERIRHMAHHDDLTQLGNRAVFNARLEEAVEAASRGEHGLALLYMDLDGFKRVNDVRGHEVGDKLLAAVAGRLRMGVREGDTVARIGGDEFAVVQPQGGQPYAAVQLAQRLVQMLGQPFEIDGQPSLVGVSVGIALYPSDGRTPDMLLRNADAALYSAKQGGRGTWRLFERSLAALQEDRFSLERDIKEAIERQEFTLAFQPICDTQTLEVCELETLLRWTHPVRGALGPGRFVPVAEASGLILPLGRWALEAACIEATSWAEPVCLSVNLSPLQFRQPGLPEQIAAVLARTGLAAERLNLEVTEGLLLDDSGLVLQTMHELRAQGVRITLDDFGTAYASLSYLRRFPFDQIKLDMSFIQAMCDDDATLAIVEAVLSLGRRLELDVVAEGVETERELETLRRLGCRRVQGFLTGRPVGPVQARCLLAEGSRAWMAQG